MRFLLPTIYNKRDSKMNTNTQYAYYRALGYTQSESMQMAVADVIAWAQANNHATNKKGRVK